MAYYERLFKETFGDMEYIPCDACGEDFPQHMVHCRFGNDLTCDACSEQIAKDFEQFHDGWKEVELQMTDAELDDWASQYDDDPNPYSGTYSEL
tara:strand:- start:203 stop:484 length:282 start_codon:yes stop_codon:yes gene_type:complete